MEREEIEAAQGLQELGEGIVYTEVRGLPAPTAHPRAAAQPVMDQLPRRIDGMCISTSVVLVLQEKAVY